MSSPSLLLLTVMVSVACAGCAHRRQPPAPARDPAAIARCLEQGGVLTTTGIASAPLCRRRYADGGKACSDNAQCAGNCIFEGTPAHGAPVTGRCEALEAAWDCSHEVVAGRAHYGVCAD